MDSYIIVIVTLIISISSSYSDNYNNHRRCDSSSSTSSSSNSFDNAQLINDDYCDCLDHSYSSSSYSNDESITSACSYLSHTTFYCKHYSDSSNNIDGNSNNEYEDGILLNPKKKSFYAPQNERNGYGIYWIYSSQVGDRVCDCCDGSDEESNRCSNTCEKQEKLLLAQMKELSSTHENGFQVKKKTPKVLIDDNQLIKLEEDISNYNQQVQLAINSQNRILFDSYYAKYYSANQRKMEMKVITKLNEDYNKALKDFSSIVGKCYDIRLNEKIFKGGSFSEVPKNFRFQFCPFMNVTQIEVVSRSSSNSDQPSLTQLGFWNDWNEDNYIRPSGTSEGTLLTEYTKGDECYEGPDRLVSVSFECGVANQIIELRENGKCNYLIRFSTPFMCSSVYSKGLLKRIESFEDKGKVKDEL